MNAPRPAPSFALSGVMTTAAIATACTAMLSWGGFVETPARLLVPIVVIGAVLGAVGVLARRARLPGVVVVLLQLVAAVPMLTIQIADRALPTPETWSAVRAAVDLAFQSAQVYAPPVSDDAPPLTPLLVPCGVVLVLMVDVLASTVRRVPLAGLPLLAAYTVPVSLLPQTLSWWVFVLTAAGFLTMMYLQESESVSRWGRALGRAPSQDAPTAYGGTGGTRVSAGRIGVVATGLAVVVPLAVPTLGVDLLELGRGGGDDEIRIVNPVVDLRRDLQRPDDLPLMRVVTDDPDPSYLRISVLNRFTGDEWSSGNRAVPSENVPDGSIPPPPGLSPSVPRTFYDYRFSAADAFDSTWLPTPFPASNVEADGDWRYDVQTMDFIAAPDDLTTAGAEWSAIGFEPDLSATDLAEAEPAPTEVSREVRALPLDLPDSIGDLAEDVTVNAESKYEQAVALQTWFRSAGGFTYSLRRSPDGSDNDTLETFLSRGEGGRVGYCEQFAAAMAVMARTLGMPSRIAIGFLRGQETGPDEWVLSSDDLHAWPEIYFQGAGWVRFEPTPGTRAPGVPEYTREQVQVSDPVQAPEGPSLQPGDGPSSRGQSLEPAPERQPVAQGDEAVDGGSAWSRWGTWVATALGLALVVLLGLVPRAVRTRRRRRRLAGPVEEVWAEVRATTVDLGLPWPASRSPRETRAALLEHIGDGGAEAALTRLVVRLERARYARPDAAGPRGDEGTASDGAQVVAALESGVGRRRLRRATWLPRSVLVRDRSAPEREVEQRETVGSGRPLG